MSHPIFDSFRSRWRWGDGLLALLAIMLGFALRQATLPLRSELVAEYPFFPYIFLTLWVSSRRGFLAGNIATGLTDLLVQMEWSATHGDFMGSPLVMFTLFSIAGNWVMAELTSARKREQVLRESQAHFIAMLGHEIKSPLAAIKAVGEALALESPSPRQLSRLERLNRSVDEIASIVDHCILLEQVDQGRLSTTRERFDPTYLIADVIETSEDPTRVTLTSPMPIQIDSDPSLLKWALANLLDNALKYSPPGSPVSVAVEPIAVPPSGCRISVRNATRASEPESFRHSFEKFYRGAHSPAVAGSGLGLWLVKRILEQLSGDVRCQPERESVCFILTLPGSLP